MIKAELQAHCYRVAFCGCDTSFESLKSVLNAGHKIERVFSWPVDGRYVRNERTLSFCHELGIDVSLDPIATKIESVWADCDVIISHIYPYMIPVSVSDKFYSLNVHPSLLPYGKGRWPLPYSILSRDDTFGITVHKHSEMWDGGDIVAATKIDLETDECIETLMAKQTLAAKHLISKILADLPTLWLNAVPQLEGSYLNYPDPSLRTLDWKHPGAELEKTVRSFGHFSSYARIAGRSYRVKDAKFVPWVHSMEPGSVLELVPGATSVAVFDGFLVIRHLVEDPELNFGDQMQSRES